MRLFPGLPLRVMASLLAVVLACLAVAIVAPRLFIGILVAAVLITAAGGMVVAMDARRRRRSN